MRPEDSLKFAIKRTEVIQADMPRDKALALRQQMIIQAFQQNSVFAKRDRENM